MHSCELQRRKRESCQEGFKHLIVSVSGNPPVCEVFSHTTMTVQQGKQEQEREEIISSTGV